MDLALNYYPKGVAAACLGVQVYEVKSDCNMHAWLLCAAENCLSSRYKVEGIRKAPNLKLMARNRFRP